MSIFESYSILCELLPMYDYLDHWCWLMNQLSKKTRSIWKDYCQAFKHLDRSTMTVTKYEKEFDTQISELLLNSTFLSCIDVNVWLKSDESFEHFVSMLSRFDDDKVASIELCGFKKLKFGDFESEINTLDGYFDSEEESDDEILGYIICIHCYININNFESRLNDRFSEYHSFKMNPDELLN